MYVSMYVLSTYVCTYVPTYVAVSILYPSIKLNDDLVPRYVGKLFSSVKVQKMSNGSKIVRIAPILTILGPFESSWRDISFETHFVLYDFFRTRFQSFRFVIEIKRKSKRKPIRKRKWLNLRGGREVPPCISLDPFRLRIRFRFNFRLIWIAKRNGKFENLAFSNYSER